MKRIISLLLALAMVFSLLGTVAYAIDDEESEVVVEQQEEAKE